MKYTHWYKILFGNKVTEMKKKEYFSIHFAAATINEYAKLTFLQSNESVPIGLFGST